MLDLASRGDLVLQKADRPLDDPASLRQALEAALPAALRRFAENALLLA